MLRVITLIFYFDLIILLSRNLLFYFKHIHSQFVCFSSIHAAFKVGNYSALVLKA